MSAQVQQAPMVVKASGRFTPPPAPCGGEQCAYVGFEVVHAETCTHSG